MKKIKISSFEAIDNMAKLIYDSFKGGSPIKSIKRSVSQTLVKLGSKDFVSNYNEAIVSKNYDYFTQFLK